MLKRITIMLDEELLKKLRTKQAKAITKSHRSVSLSNVINEQLRLQCKK